MEAPSTAEQELLAANAAFYSAFESCDLGAMSELWEHSERVVCTHPGWQTLRGWSKIAPSFQAIFENPNKMQFILTNEHAMVLPDSGWVTLDENLLQGAGSGTVATVNWFVRSGGVWLMAGHHGSSVMRTG